MTTLVIVESPAKAKTLSRILGPGFDVQASFGHVRDLPESAEEIPARVKKEPWARLGVDTQGDFEPVYVIPADKKKRIKALREALRTADELLLATDEDREGESISWHVVQVLRPKVPVRRIVFHEITAEAIHEALENPRDIDENLVRAQESRRILDRLFGYELSPVLWKKVRRGLSAGRVQSVAVRLCVLRERQRRRFRAAEYWDAEADFEKEGRTFTARLVRLGGERLATGQDFDADTGDLKSRSKARWLRGRDEVEKAVAAWDLPWKVSSVVEKPIKRRPAPPFTTSSLQQEANRKLRFSARFTMRVAQRLYEGVDFNGERVGLITYMRTDSVTLSRKALADAQEVIRRLYGDDYTDGPRQYRTRSRSAQEAHEAIRPTEMSRTPESLRRSLKPEELKLYDLIWKRAVASQMAEARLRSTSVEIAAPVSGSGAVADAAPDGAEGVFAASGMRIEFPGFFRAYVEGSDDPTAEIADREVLLPRLAEDEACEPVEVRPKGRSTVPPPRFTEASLVKKLEAEGIGRPSTYASIIETIQQRGYIVKQDNALVPTFTAHAVTKLLERHFRDYVDTRFTARMEQELDDIAAGRSDWKSHLKGFYFGHGEEEPGLERLIAGEEPKIEYPRIEIGRHPETGDRIVVRVGRYGPYLQHEGDEKRAVASVPADVAPADLTVEEAAGLLAKAERGAQMLGHHPESKLPVYLAHGRFGPYVQLGETPERGSKEPKPKRASLPRGVDEHDVTLEKAVVWLSLPRTLGIDEGEEVIAATGRFGPFVKRGSETRSLTADDDVYTIDLARARELLAQPKGRRRRSARKVVRELGANEAGAEVRVLEGPYGPYLTDGKLNASLPKGGSPAELTLEQAVAILAERGKAPKRRRRAASTKNRK